MVRQAIKAGIRIIQLREKDLPPKTIYEEALRIRSLTRRCNAVFIINDRIDIACAVDADGVHLGQDDMPAEEARKIMGRRKIVGISTHSLKEARDAQRHGADYIGFGPVFHTRTKDAGMPKDLGTLSGIKRSLGIPVVAIGGITRINTADVMEAGADAIAVASAILSGDIGENTKKFLNLL
jgi:thiamine-phosphate pyrophosphorylase